ncbi:MAG TPA: amidohydrolase family protein [Gemmatimonadales bacterium]|nr:amidohydrolase family protein [Gemmatimonadales bacterium]
MFGLDWGHMRNRIVAAVRGIRRGVSGPLLAAFLAPGACGAPVELAVNRIALTNVRVLDGNGGPVQDDVTIVIQGGRIAHLGPASSTPIPTGSRILDLTGHVVTPGFIDMHYHVTTGAMRYRRDAAGKLDSTYDRALAERLLRIALSRGITTIRDPGASPLEAAIALRDAVDSQRVLGPRIFTAGPIISNPRLTEAEIRGEVATQAAAGANYIKLYAGIGPEQLAAAVDEAHRRRKEVIGHLQRTSWTEAALAGIDFLTHGGNWHEAYVLAEHRAEYERLGGTMRARISWLEWLELIEGGPVDSMIDVLEERQVPVDPTLIAYHTKFWWRDSIYQRDPDVALVPEVLANWEVLGMPTRDWSDAEFDRAQAAWPRMLALVREMHLGGVMLTTGSDLASPWVIPGVALHQELALLESAGIRAGEVLRLATRNGAASLGILGETGTVEVGKRADLVVLEADPLVDISNTRRIRYVVLGGRMYTPEELVAGR